MMRSAFVVGVAILCVLGTSACGGSGDEEAARIVFSTSRAHEGPIGEFAGVNLELYSMAEDGSGLVRLTNDPAVDIQPRPSPVADEIAFLSNRDTGGESFDLYVMREDGSETRRLTTDGGVLSAEWSPDGSQLAYTLERGGHSTVRLIGHDGADDRELVAGSWPSWSPDTKRILFTVGEFLQEPQSLAIVDVDGGKKPRRVLLALDNASESSWSPDGERIAFISNPAGYAADSSQWDEEIYVADVDGTNVILVSDRRGNDHWPPSWSSDGRCLVWQGDAHGGEMNAEIYAAAVDVPDPQARAVTATEAFELLPAWTHGPCSL